MKRFKVNLLSCVVGAMLIPLLLTTGIAQAAGWSVVTSPSPGTTDNILGGVAIISANNIWAVGYSNTNGSLKTLTELWNGTTWSVVASPSPNANLNFLFGVAADPSTGQTWAVGTIPGTTFFKTLIEFHP